MSSNLIEVEFSKASPKVVLMQTMRV